MGIFKRHVNVNVKLLVVVIVAVLAVVGVQTWLNNQDAMRREEATSRERLATVYGDYTESIRAMQEIADSISSSFADRADIQELLVKSDRAGLLALLTPVYAKLNTDHKVVQFNILEPTGVVFVRINDPQRWGDSVTYRRPVAAALKDRQTISSIEIGPNRLGVRAVSPMLYRGSFVGLFEVGLNYDQLLVQNLKARTGADYRIWVAGEAAAPAGLQPATEAPTSPLSQVFYYASTNPGSPLLPQDVYRRALENRQPETWLTSQRGQESAVSVTPIVGYQDHLLGILEISTSRVDALAALRQSYLTTLAFAIGLALSGFVLLGVSTNIVVLRPLSHLARVARQQLTGELAARVELRTGDEFEELGNTLNTLTGKLDNTLQGLEKTVAERTHDLERRSTFLQASADVSRAASSVLEPDRLIQLVVDMIRERFNLYYVGLFLVDEAREWAVLRAGTGEAGRAMLARGHRIKADEGTVGWSIAHAQPRIASGAGEDGVRLVTPELPDTRSEAALPLRSRGYVLGALTVQSAQPDAFDEAAVGALQTMADQVAVAIDNARLFAKNEAALETVRRAYGEMSDQAWMQLLRTRGEWGYRYTRVGQAVAASNQKTGNLLSAEGEWQADMREAARSGQNVQGNNTGEATFAMPLKVRDQVIGALRLRKSVAGKEWTTDEIRLIETLTEQLDVALESARLHQDTQRRAAREQLTRQITDNIRAAVSVEDAVRRAVQEMSRALDAEMVARIGTEQELLSGLPGRIE